MRGRGSWRVEITGTGRAFLVTPEGFRTASMIVSRARGIAAALNAEEGRRAVAERQAE